MSERAALLEALDNLHAEATGQGGTYGFTREAVRALLPGHRCRSCGEGLCDPCVALLVALYEPLLTAIDEAVKQALKNALYDVDMVATVYADSPIATKALSQAERAIRRRGTR